MFAGITGTLEILLANAYLPAPSRETNRPAADGGQRAWPASKSPIFYVTDRSNGFRFLVDTGAEVSVIPHSATDRKHRRDSLTLQAVNDSPIALNLRRPTPHRKHWTATNFSMDFHCCRCQTAHTWCRFFTTLQPPSGHGTQLSD